MNGRYQSTALVSAGWIADRLTQPSRLNGANGLRTGADGRLYVAQVAGSQISAVDVDSGEIETISPMGGDIVGPDDLAFDDDGNLYATELTEGRVGMRDSKGNYRVVYGDMPCANPITFHQGRLFAGECRPGGRIMELDLNGGAPKVLLENVPLPNAFEIGPDGKLYFPVMGANEIWRIDPEGGEPEVVAKDLGVPDSVKFDAKGFMVSTQVATGQVLRIDPNSGNKVELASIAPGLDNLSFVGDRLFVSSISGQINEIVGPGQVRSVIHDGLQWPMGIAVAASGELYIADGGYSYTLMPGGERQCVGMLFSPGYPGFTRGVTASAPGEWVVTTANGQVARFWPGRQESEFIASGFDRLMGVALSKNGTPVVAEWGTGKVLAIESSGPVTLLSGLAKATDVAIDSDDNCYVSDAATGVVARIAGGSAHTIVDGLQNPEGIAIRGSMLYILDVGSKQLIAVDLRSGARVVIASNLPVGAPPGVVRKQLGAVGEMSGPMTSFTGLTVAPDGTLYVSADAEGSVLRIRPVQQGRKE